MKTTQPFEFFKLLNLWTLKFYNLFYLYILGVIYDFPCEISYTNGYYTLNLAKDLNSPEEIMDNFNYTVEVKNQNSKKKKCKCFFRLAFLFI